MTDPAIEGMRLVSFEPWKEGVVRIRIACDEPEGRVCHTFYARQEDYDDRVNELDTHAAEVARLTASRDDWKARSESFDRQGYEVQRNLDAAREEVARLRGAARKVLECADKGIGVARLSADDMHWLCPRCNAKGTCKPGCALNALLGALDELAALAPAARKESDRG